MSNPEVMSLLDRARSWVAQDPDPGTRSELTDLLGSAEAGDEESLAELRDRFSGTLEFGTAGLRGAMGAGPRRMNQAVVVTAAAGLAAYLRERGARGPVVIGYDARHESDVWARVTGEVLSGAGLQALLLPAALPTPVLAYAILELGCSAGVMVTASHNPREDNGYKVYLGDGSQIVPPADREIARHIAAAGPATGVERGQGARVLEQGIVDRYLDAVAELVPDGPRDLDLVYTPLHGVGAGCVLQVLETAGFSLPRVVAEQEDPDPDFPTTPYPNPEEPGALDLAIALAERHSADLVVANDPDADRCAVAVPGPTGWRVLSGDEVGSLLGAHLLRRRRRGRYAASLVSSSLLGVMAAAEGVDYVETLTGFKWIGRVGDLAFGYEEALGYCCDPEHVRDKDGVSALLLVCEIAAAARAQGRTLLDLLDDLACRHGLHATDQLAVRVADLARIEEVMERLRAHPPTVLGGLTVESVEDLADGAAGLPPTEALRYRLADGARVVVRPSGTEPKLKCYLEVVVEVEAGDDATLAVQAARIAAAGRLDALRTDVALAAGIDPAGG